MRRQNTFNKNREKKERLIMLGSAVFVLTALTMTGVYVKGNAQKEKNDGYTIDFAALEENSREENSQTEEYITVPTDDFTASVEDGSEKMADITNDDFLDYIPSTDEINLTAEAEGTEVAEEEPMFAQAAEFAEAEDTSVETAGEAVSKVDYPELNFTENDTLAWPIVGNVLINYSMDKTTYFATLDQYKYSSAIVIGANQGETISAAANGKVIEIYENEEIGKAVVMELGNGYELTYGQLEDIQVSKGSYVETGDIVGKVASPTKYYSIEGANVYFALTKDGVPVNPMGKLN